MKNLLIKIIALIIVVAAGISVNSYTHKKVEDIKLGSIVNFGKTTDGSNVQTFSGDRIYLSFATPASSGTITSCWARVRVTATGSTVQKFVIYSTSAGEADTFLAQSDEVTVNWTTSTLTEYPMSGANRIAITSGVSYALGVWSDDPGTPSYEYKRDNTASVNRFAAETYVTAGNPTSPFVSGGSSNGPMNFYCEYDDGAGGGGVISNQKQSIIWFND